MQTSIKPGADTESGYKTDFRVQSEVSVTVRYSKMSDIVRKTSDTALHRLAGVWIFSPVYE